MPLITSSPFKVPGVPGWLALLHNDATPDSDKVNGIGVLGSDLYLVGSSGFSTKDTPCVVKIDNGATAISFEKEGTTLQDASRGLQFIGFDTSNNLFVYGARGNPNYDGVVVKYNTSGVKQSPYPREFTSGGNWAVPTAGTLDSSNNLIIAGITQLGNGTQGDSFLFKMNSAGTRQWCKVIDKVSSWETTISDVTTDSSGNIYVIGTFKGISGVSGWDSFIMKFNSSGALQWQTAPGVGGASDQGVAIGFSPAGTLHATVLAASNPVILQLNDSTGAITSQRNITGVDDIEPTLAFDTSNNIYVGGYNQGGTPFGYVCKLNSSLSIQWGRKFTSDIFGFEPFVYSIETDGEWMYVGGTVSTAFGGKASADDDMWVAKLNQNGSGTGTYQVVSNNTINITYASVSLSDTASSLSDQSLSMVVTDDPSTIQLNAGNYNDQDVVPGFSLATTSVP